MVRPSSLLVSRQLRLSQESPYFSEGSMSTKPKCYLKSKDFEEAKCKDCREYPYCEFNNWILTI